MNIFFLVSSEVPGGYGHGHNHISHGNDEGAGPKECKEHAPTDVGDLIAEFVRSVNDGRIIV
eukprot:CAMPEP_0194155290 /NCGR_PEP_ID=MMETSP0152-20130528/63886_1 /TAXON_ID=1049557 /ORGANISM="Thalassiothrix antarctica, Strain L6-D1" /LENGTH=61 /DNA_ID=CAMNT_0038862011 /DNA_START=758 /DNA_END=943 /DNA_ORIENTATION=+